MPAAARLPSRLAPEPRSRRRLSLRTHLLLVVLVALVPMALFSIGVVIALWKQQRIEVEHGVEERAHALALTVEHEINNVTATLGALTQSPLLDDNALEAYYQLCRRVLPTQPGWRTLRVLSPLGEQLLNAEMPFDVALPSMATLEYVRQVIHTGRPAVSDLFVSPTTGKQTVDVAVPVLRNGQLAYILVAGLDPSAFSRLARSQDLRDDGIIAIFDARDRFVAHSRNMEQFLGQPLTGPLLAHIRATPTGVARLPVQDGREVYSAWYRVASSGWTVSVNVPAAAIETTLVQGLSALIAIGLGLLALGTVLATMLGQSVASSITSAAQAAVRVARREPFEPVTSRVAEVSVLISALDEAAALLARESEERKHAEEERARLLTSEQAARERAEKESRAKDHFLAMLGHELRNPLAAISNAVQVLERTTKPDDMAGRARQVIVRQTAHLARMVDDLLDVGRVVMGKIVLHRQPLELADATARVLTTLRTAGKTEHHQLLTEFEPTWLHGDGTRIDQIITNLVTNALKYTLPGGTIRVIVENTEDHAILRVEDTGVGIPPELLPRIFDLFVQGEHALDRSQGGLGIGLTLVRQLVELHGGTIEAASAGPGQGSSFTVRLPAMAAAAVVHEPHVHAAAVVPCTILLVEDNLDSRQMLRNVLELSGHTVEEAGDGEAGVHAALRLSPALALVDIGLPGLDGYEVARRIRKAMPDGEIYMVALTGYGLPEDRRRALDAGFDEHLAKPIDARALARLIEAAQARRQQSTRGTAAP